MASFLPLHDLSKLVDKDPHTRRSAMDSLKAFVQTDLDDKSLPFFLEQLALESSKGDASCTCAMSLVVEVARVHRRLIVPHIPRIIATVVRSLPSSAGAHSLLQACARVVSALARYAIDAAALGVEHQVLESLCHPLLGVLCNKVEPVAVGAAACLQALVESEKWKFAAPDLVKAVCQRAAMALGDKGTQTVAHMHLLRTVVKFHPEALQGCGAALLEVGVDILLTKRDSWQQRAAAAQLLGALLSIVDQQTLASHLATTSDALERSRLDKVTVVRSAVGEALNIAKSLAARIHHPLQSNCFQESPLFSPNKLRELRNRARRRSLWSKEDVSRLSKEGLSSSQELQPSQKLEDSIHWIKSFKEVEEDKCAMAAGDDSVNDAGNDSRRLFLEEERREPSQAMRPVQINKYIQSADMSRYSNGYCQAELQRSNSDEWEAFLTDLNHDDDLLDHSVSPKFPETRIPEEFLLFATPRRLVWSLQSLSSPHESGCTFEQALETSIETVSQSAWSVRDNPMATDSEEGSPKKSSFSELACEGDSSLDSTKANIMSQVDVQSVAVCDPSLSALTDPSGLLFEGPSGLCRPDLGGADQLKPTRQIHESSDHDPVDQKMSTQCDTAHYSSSQIAQIDFSEGKDKWLSRQPMETSDRQWMALNRGLGKIQRCIETLLGGALCAVVIFPMVIAIINCWGRQHNIHASLPT